MHQKLKSIIFIFLFLAGTGSFAQDAPWISYPSSNNTVYGVYHFRKKFHLEKVPERLMIHVSADNRYKLFVNGKRVCYGPAKGDLKTYKFDVIDIAPFLNDGENLLASLVYNGGADKPLAFISAQTAFMLRAENEEFNEMNTGAEWKTYKNPAYEVISYNKMLFENRWFYGFYACGGGDEVFADKFPWNWETARFDDSDWLNAEPLVFEKQPPWNLVPRNIAFMDNHTEFPARIRKVDGVSIQTGTWDGKSSLKIPVNSKVSVLIDFDFFTMGYPELTIDGGENSSIQLKYAEALYEEVNLKAHRDSVEGKIMFGVWDIFHADGEKRTFQPLWKRAFRYVQFNIETQNEPLEIVSYRNEYSGYPYSEMAVFESSNEKLNEIFEICLRTLRMCSGETYYDTPFYEQLSYGGDNRPISAISTYNSTDDRLLREVLRLYPQSENRETGLFKSAYPSRFDFDMGSWSLAWIQSLHDFYFMRGDTAFVAQFKDKIEGVLKFYERHLDEQTGLIGSVANQNFIDWSITKGSIPRSDENREMKQSVLLTLYFAHTLDCTTSLFNELGFTEDASHWKKVSDGIKMAVYTNCWDKQKQLFRDYPNKEIYSQHTNLIAILCDVLPPAEQKQLMQRIVTYDRFDEMASSYFSFFLFKAMQKTGQEDLFLNHLDFWYKFIDRGHTTCGETGFASHDRSDCHAWSAHPAYYLLSTVCGIKPADIGFHSVVIEPHLGDLKSVSASMPHPKGRIQVAYLKANNKLNVNIELPEGLTGKFYFNNQEVQLNDSKNEFQIKL